MWVQRPPLGRGALTPAHLFQRTIQARHGIRLNAIAPGPIPTEGAFSRLLPAEELVERMLARIPAGRMGTPEELAELAAYLVSDASDWMRGEVVTLDGGEWLQGAGELNELLETVAALAHRMADRRKITLELQPCKDRLAVRNDPFRVLQALYLSIREAVSVAPEGGTVTLSAGRQGATFRLVVESKCETSPKKVGLLYLEILLDEIGGKVESAFQDGRLSIRLLLPPTPRA